jgi:uncharacterized protein (DUF2141 family)
MSLIFSITNYPTGINPISVAVGDLNGDGQLDLVTANIGGDPAAPIPPDGTVSVLLGSGGGTFSAATTNPTGSLLAFSVAIGDLNGDGKLDLAVANYGDPMSGNPGGTISIFLGDGDGTFSAATPYSTLTGLAGAQTDLGSGAGTTVSVLLGQVGGGFSNRTLTTGTNPSSVAIGDLNGDGRLDLAVANAGSNTVSVLLGNGDGSFQAQTQYATGDQS